MLKIFYQNRNIIGLVLVISPFLSFLFLEQSFGQRMACLCGGAAALPLLCLAFHRLPFRLWTALCAAAAWGGLRFTAHVQTPAAALSLSLLAGMGLAGLLLLLPAHVTVGWFRRTKTIMLGLTWSCALLLSHLWQRFLIAPAYPALLLILLSLVIGIFFLQRPPLPSALTAVNPMTSGRQRAFLRPTVFISALSASLALSLTFAFAHGQNGDDPLSSLSAGIQTLWQAALLLLPATAPLLVSLLVEKKGVFSGCVLLIFLSESAMLFSGNYDVGSHFFFLGRLTALCALTVMGVVLPVLTYYLYGPVGYTESLGRLTFFLPIGLLMSMPACWLARSGELPQEEAVILMLFLLVLSFFSIFSAWKHRFVLLKNKIS